MALFDLPISRSDKSTDKNIVTKTKSKKQSSIVVKGNSLLSKISAINALVESKLGKYKNEYAYYMADDETKFKDYVYNIIQHGDCSIDTETTGLNPISDKIVGISLYSKGQKGLYIPINHKSYITGVEVEGQLDKRIISEQLKLLVNNNVKFKYYNAKFDIRVIQNNLDVYVPAWFDAHIAAMCLNENEPHGLKTLHSKYVLEGKEDEFSFGKLFEGVTFDMVPIKTGYIYAARDAVDTDELVDFQLPYLTKGTQECTEQDLEGVSNVFWNIEMPYVKVIADMENTGIAFDTEYAKSLSEKYHKMLDDILNEFYGMLDMYKNEIEVYKLKNVNHKLSNPISVSSPTQLAILFYDILKIKPIDENSPRGTGVEILEKIDNPLCKIILDYRKVEKLLSTYIDKLPECLQKDNRIHCNFNQYGAKTGRLSSDEPNMQNIPSHNKDIRKMFVASEGNVMLSSDFSQQEPRCMAAMCGDEIMLQAYKDDKDLYASIASLAFNMPYKECLEFMTDSDGNWIYNENGDKITYPAGKERRSSAKSILLGILYGRGINSVAEQLHTTKQKAQQIQDKVFKGFPAIKQFEKDSISMAENLGYVTTFWGRKRRLPEMQLKEFEFKFKPGYGDIDPLSFETETVETDVPEQLKQKYRRKLRQNPYKKRTVYEEALNEGIIITDNGGKIADATRQCVNSRIQGSAADMSKLAGRLIYDNERLRELGFKLLVPIHDEYLAECPKENAKECAKIFSECMCQAAKDLGIPIHCDVVCSYQWYGDGLNLEEI